MESQTDGPMEGSGEQNGNGHAATGSNTPDEHPKQGGAEEAELLWKLRKYLVLMAILVAAITFQAGLAPPGGFWQETEHGRVASDVVLRSSYPRRYLVFFYCNTTAFGASLMVLMLLLLSRNAVWLRALQFAMILGLLGLMGAYAAGSCREVRTSVYIWVLLVGIFAYVTLHVVFFKHLAPKKLRILLYRIRASWKGTLGQMMTHGSGRTIDDQEAPDQLELGTRDGQEASSETERTRDDQEASERETTAEEQEEASNKRKEDLERNRSSLLVLATLVATVTYVAGLTPPGGFWSENDNNHIAGDPVLRDHYPCRFKAFLICNATAFAGSLVIIIMVLSQTAVDHVVKSNALRLCVIVSLFALMGAYAAGSCREVHTSIYVFALVGAVLLYLIIQCIEPAVPKSAYVEDTIKRVKGKNKEMVQKVRDFIAALLEVQDQADSNKPSNDDDVNGFQKLRTYLLLLGILAATVTFQAGMNPPGGFWTDNSDGHTPGNPILEVTNPKRYKAFFYCNAIAFVASLVIIILLQSQLITIRAMKRHVLQTAMALVLFGLMGAYVAGSSRKFSTSLYVFVLVLLVFAYVVLHILYERYIANTGASEAETSSNRGSSELTAEEKKEKEKKEKDLQKRRKFLMLLAILAASITYQTGISPPGGFWTDNKNGHRAGYPVFRDEFRHRYRVFFYFNATAFMASLAVILLLVSKRLCNRGLRCFALRVCVLVDLISLMGAFATGSCRKVTTSVYVILVVLAVFVYVIAQVLFLKFAKKKVNDLLRRGMSRARPSERQDPSPSMDNGISLPDTDKKRTEHKWRKDLMLIGTLAVTVTYQAGLLPPGGVWPDDRDGHFTGDPILHDTNLTRYKVFFYCNATAFMASMVMVILLLNNTISNYKRSLFAMKIAMVLNLLGLLGAFAAGSCRKFKTSVYIFALVIAVIIYIIIHVLLSFDKLARLVKKQGEEWVEWVRCLKSSAPSGTDSNNQPSSGEPGQSPPV